MIQKQKIKTTNYLSPYLYYNKFRFWLIRLPQFIEPEFYKKQWSSSQLLRAFDFQYESGLRISEVLGLTKQDIDLNHRIVTIKQAKTGSNQRTTIVPYSISSLEKFMGSFSKSEKLFPFDRFTMWKFAKNTGKIAGLHIAEIQTTRTVDGVWTHLFRKSCSKRMAEAGASRELRMVKLRHVNRDAHDTYDRPDLNALLDWEDEHFNIKVVQQ